MIDHFMGFTLTSNSLKGHKFKEVKRSCLILTVAHAVMHIDCLIIMMMERRPHVI